MKKQKGFTGKYFVILLAATLILAVVVASKTLSGKNYQRQAIDTEVAKIQTQADDTEVDSIETDLENTDFETLDKELQDIDAEMQTSF